MAAATKTQETYVTIPKQNVQTATIIIEGTSPLVTNPFPNKAAAEIKFKQNVPVAEQPKKKQYAQRFPWNDFANSAYWITPVPTKVLHHEGYPKEGCVVADIFSEDDWNNLMAKQPPKFGFQVSGIKESAITGAYRLGLIKNLPTARMFFNITNSVVDTLYKQSVIEIITDKTPIMREDCLSTFSSGADMRYRMMFENWKMELDISYLADFINIENILYWFSLGGLGVGLGENRAEKGGPWGSYQVSAG